jgi:hypothetical protein
MTWHDSPAGNIRLPRRSIPPPLHPMNLSLLLPQQLSDQPPNLLGVLAPPAISKSNHSPEEHAKSGGGAEKLTPE